MVLGSAHLGREADMRRGVSKWLVVAAAAAVVGLLLTGRRRCTACDPEGDLRGNPDTGTFHRRSCRYFGSSGSTERFGSHREAVDAGFTPCGLCEP